MNIFSDDRQKSLKELLEVISKGVDLLANENLNKDLYDAFEKYAYSTMKMVDEAYSPPYWAYSEDLFLAHHFNHNPMNTTFNPHISMPHSAMSAYNISRQSSEYRNKLKNLLQKLILLAQKVVYE